MEEDFLSDLGALALAARMKRISDLMVHSARDVYKSLGFDIEPNWYLVLKLLERRHQLSVTEIASILRFSHSSVVAIVRKMKERGYLECRVDGADGRRQLAALSTKAKNELPRLNDVWAAGERAIASMIAPHHDILVKLTHIENQLLESDFKSRTMHEITTD